MRHSREAVLLPFPIPFCLSYYLGYNKKITFLFVFVSTETSILVHGVFSMVQCWKFCATLFISTELHYLSSRPKSIIFHSVGDRHLALTCWWYWPTCLRLVRDEHAHLKIFSYVALNRRAPVNIPRAHNPPPSTLYQMPRQLLAVVMSHIHFWDRG